jgi:hypothetical protein
MERCMVELDFVGSYNNVSTGYNFCLKHISRGSIFIKLRPEKKIYTGVPGGKVNILGGRVSVIPTKKVYMNMCAIPNGFRYLARSILSLRAFLPGLFDDAFGIQTIQRRMVE